MLMFRVTRMSRTATAQEKPRRRHGGDMVGTREADLGRAAEQQVHGAREGDVAPVGERRDDQARRVAEVLHAVRERRLHLPHDESRSAQARQILAVMLPVVPDTPLQHKVCAPLQDVCAGICRREARNQASTQQRGTLKAVWSERVSGRSEEEHSHEAVCMLGISGNSHEHLFTPEVLRIQALRRLKRSYQHSMKTRMKARTKITHRQRYHLLLPSLKLQKKKCRSKRVSKRQPFLGSVLQTPGVGNTAC
jgi:hypothetical protein